jgi:hypothetical protein
MLDALRRAAEAKEAKAAEAKDGNKSASGITDAEAAAQCVIAKYAAENFRKDPHFQQLMRHAERIAVNRTVAGVHFPADSAAGMVLGQALSDYYLRRFGGTGSIPSRTFDGKKFKGDFSYESVLEKPQGDSEADICRSPELFTISQSTLLKHVWLAALDEWRPVRQSNAAGDSR